MSYDIYHSIYQYIYQVKYLGIFRQHLEIPLVQHTLFFSSHRTIAWHIMFQYCPILTWDSHT